MKLRCRPAALALLVMLACAKREPVTLEAESLQGVSQDAAYGVAAANGWASYDEASYSLQRAALTRTGGAVMKGRIPDFRKGTYRVEVVTYNYGAGRNSFELTVGGVTKKLTYGGANSIAGLMLLDDLFFDDVASPEISVRAIGIGQSFLVIDRITLQPFSGKRPPVLPPWEGDVVDIQGDPCVNCVQAENLTPVSQDANYGVASGSGWASYAEGSYSDGRAALTRFPGAVMSGRIPNLKPGPYRVTIAVAVSGDQQNTFDLQLGTETKRITFGGAGFTGGVTHLDDVLFERVDSERIAVKAVGIGQSYLIVDAFSLEPLASLPQPTQQPYKVANVDPIIDDCWNCVEAESLQPVSADPNYGATSGSGWASYEQETYSQKRAALTRLPGAVMSGTIPNFRRGAYSVTVSVLNFDPALENTFEITLGNETQRVTFGPGRDTGVNVIRDVRFRDVTSSNLAVRAVAVGQPYLVIDTISLRPLQ